VQYVLLVTEVALELTNRLVILTGAEEVLALGQAQWYLSTIWETSSIRRSTWSSKTRTCSFIQKPWCYCMTLTVTSSTLLTLLRRTF